MAAGSHADLEAGLPAVADRRDDIIDRRAARDERGSPIDHGVPDLAMRVVGGVIRLDDLPGEPSDAAQVAAPGKDMPGGTWVSASTLPSESLNQATMPPLASRETPFSVVGPSSPMA